MGLGNYHKNNPIPLFFFFSTQTLIYVMEIRTTIEGKSIRIYLCNNLEQKINRLQSRKISITTSIIESKYIYIENCFDLRGKNTIDIYMDIDYEEIGEFLNNLEKLINCLDSLSYDGKIELGWIIFNALNE